MAGAREESPRLAVVLPTDAYETLAEVMASLRAQTVPQLVEAVVVGLGDDVLEVPAADAAALGAVTVASAPGATLGEARAEGARRARAPFVFFGETHSFPRPRFAEAVVAAHARGFAAVVPTLRNANPDSAVSWANLVLDYGRWVGLATGAEVEAVPEVNCSFRRELLVEHGDRLPSLLDSRGGLSPALRARGHRLYAEPAAELDHLNVSAPGSWLPERYLAGRLVGGARAARFGAPRRAVYLAASPAVPLVHLARAARVLARLERRAALAAVPALVAGSLAWACGEAVGYARGTRRAASRMLEYELHKAAHAPRPPGRA